MNAELRGAVERALVRMEHDDPQGVSYVRQALRDQEAEMARLREECNSQQRLAIQEQILAEKAEYLLREAHPFVPITYSSTGYPQLHDRITAHLGGENNER